MDIYTMCRWFEYYEGHEFQRNNWILFMDLDATGKLNPTARDPVQDRAWTAYYNSVLNDPEANDEQRCRATEMLKRFGPGGLLDKLQFNKPSQTFKPMPKPAVDINDLV